MFKDYNKLYKVFEDNGRLEKENAELKRIIERQSKEINTLKKNCKVLSKGD